MQLHVRKEEAKNRKNLSWQSSEKQDASSEAYVDQF